MVVAVTIEVPAMTTLTVGTSCLANGAAGQLANGVVTGGAAKLTMGLTGGGKRRLRGSGMTVGAQGH